MDEFVKQKKNIRENLHNDSPRSVHLFQANSLLAPQNVSFSTHQVQRVFTAPQQLDATDAAPFFRLHCRVGMARKFNLLASQKGVISWALSTIRTRSTGHSRLTNLQAIRPVRVLVRTCPRFIIAGPAHENDTWSLRPQASSRLAMAVFLSRALWPGLHGVE